jgi:ABC-type ATPase with predicted acetyltransferase domain
MSDDRPAIPHAAPDYTDILTDMSPLEALEWIERREIPDIYERDREFAKLQAQMTGAEPLPPSAATIHRMSALNVAANTLRWAIEKSAKVKRARA